MTPCRQLGFKEGDLFVVSNVHDDMSTYRGAVVQLDHDDGSVLPLFTILFSPVNEIISSSVVFYLHELTPIEEVPTTD